jgi:hypothetical protein
MNPRTARLVATSPVWFPMLACATLMDFMLFPYYRQIGCDPAKGIADAAWKIMGV